MSNYTVELIKEVDIQRIAEKNHGGFLRVSLLIAISVAVLVVGFYILKSKKTNNERPADVKSMVNKEVEVPENSVTLSDKCTPKSDILRSNPSFNDVAGAGCGSSNIYIGKEVKWEAVVSDYAHTSGIRFRVIDGDHPDSDEERGKHGLFWGTFLAFPPIDPRQTDEGIKNWSEKWNSSWIMYIMDTYGNIDYLNAGAKKFLVTTIIDYVDCDVTYDGCYIEAEVKKVEVKR